MSHKSKVSRISINLAIVCFLVVGFPPLASNFESKYALKSPPNMIFFIQKITEFRQTDEISFSVYLYFLRYWAICVFQLLVNQVVTS